MASRNTAPKLQAGLGKETTLELSPGDQGRVMSSRTWSYASGDLNNCNTIDDIDDRNIFVQEYNRLAQKHGIRLLIPENEEKCMDDQRNPSPRRSSWLSRTFRRHISSQSSNTKSDASVHHKRSVGDVAKQMVHPGKDALKNEDLQELVRLCGKSFLYLPSEYAPCSLILPTSLRATAHYLVQHGIGVAGVFRIPGSVRVVNEIYDYYSAARDGSLIRGTVRNPNLPSHITVTVHDVASAFKKFLANLPGGILGSLPLFDAFVAIESQVQGHSELERPKRDNLRARLIALAVGTVQSQFRRELICAVFGMLCYLGQEGQKASQEDGEVVSELMGYNAFGIIFGPLLAGDLLDTYTMKLADPSSGLFLEPASISKAKKYRKKSSAEDEPHPSVLTVNKVRVANDVTEMLITNWSEVVRNMRDLNLLRSDSWAPKPAKEQKDSILKTSSSDPFAQKQPLTLRNEASKPMMHGKPKPDNAVPRPNKVSATTGTEAVDGNVSRLYMKRTRPNSHSPLTTQGLAFKQPTLPLSPMGKESTRDNVLSLNQRKTSGSVDFTRVSKIPRPVISSIRADTTAQSMQPTKKTSETFNRYCNNTNGSSERRLHIRSQPQDCTRAKLSSQADGAEPHLLGGNGKAISTVQSSCMSLQLGEEQPMGWLGEYLNHAESNQTTIELTYGNDDPVPTKQTQSQGLPGIKMPHGAHSRATTVRGLQGVSDANSGSQVCPAQENLSGDKSDLKLLGQNLGRKRSKIVSTLPTKQWRSQETTNADRKLTRRSIGGAVRAMAAMFDNAAKDSAFVPTPLGKLRVEEEPKTPIVLSPYTVNSSPPMSSGLSTTPRKLGVFPKVARKGRLGRFEHQETPTRQPLRSLRSDNTGTSNTAQVPPGVPSGLAGHNSSNLSTNPVMSSKQPQPCNLERETARPSNSTKPEVSRAFRLVPDEAGSTKLGEHTALHRNNQDPDVHLGDLKRRLRAKEEECNDLQDAIVTKDADISSLKKQLQRTKTESNDWKQRAEVAEKRIEAFVSRATRIKEISRSTTDQDISLQRLDLHASPHRAERSSSSTHSRDGDIARGHVLGMERGDGGANNI